MKRKDGEGREKAMQHFQVVKSQMPDRVLPYAALAWLRMDKRTYAAAVNELTAMMAKIPKLSDPGAVYSAEAKFPFRWSGRCGSMHPAAGGIRRCRCGSPQRVGRRDCRARSTGSGTLWPGPPGNGLRAGRLRCPHG